MLISSVLCGLEAVIPSRTLDAEQQARKGSLHELSSLHTNNLQVHWVLYAERRSSSTALRKLSMLLVTCTSKTDFMQFFKPYLLSTPKIVFFLLAHFK